VLPQFEPRQFYEKLRFLVLHEFGMLL
jgi:hypothetical protein